MADTSLVFNILAKNKTQGTLSGVAGGFKKAFLPAVAVLGAVTAAAGSLISAGEEAAASNNRLKAIFKSMGDPTGKAAEAAIKYSEALSTQVGIDDDVIKGAMGVLATFGNVSGAAGRAAGIFDRATVSAANLSAAGFGDMTTTSKMLGKALQDPIKYTGSLARMGVVFTAQEKLKIAALVKSGNLLDAQKLILAAVEKRTGGVAVATATASAKMAVGWQNLKEDLGQKLLPVFAKFVGWMTTATAWASKHQTAVLLLGAAAGILAAAIIAVNIAMMLNPAVLITAAVIALAAGMVWLYKNVGWVHDAFNTLAVGGMRMASLLVTGFKYIVDAVLGFVGKIIDGAAMAFGWVPNLGPKLKAAAANFDTFRANVNNSLSHISKDLTIHANTLQAQQAIDKVRGMVKYPLIWPLSLAVKYPLITPLHTPGHAAGTKSAPPGWSWVGEKGPELLNLRGGETILDNKTSMGVTAGGGGTGGGGSRVEVHHQPIIVKIGPRELAYIRSDFDVLVPGAA